jgi:hypothetical protein
MGDKRLRDSSTPSVVAAGETREARARLLLDGARGIDGFVFHDGHNQPVHQAAPGLLGIVEGHRVMHQWKPRIVRWLDDSEHFFNHLFAEFGDEPAFEALGRELQEVRSLDAPLTARNHVLFQHLRAWTRELERDLVRAGSQEGRDRDDRLVFRGGSAATVVSLDGPWTARYRQGPGSYLERLVDVPVNWELLPWIEDYAGTMRFTRVFWLDDISPDRRMVLRFDGVDYFADVWVNGHHVGGHEGYFEPFELDVTPFVRSHDENIVRLAVTSPNDPSGSGTHVTSGWHDFSPASAFPNRKTLIKGTLGHHDAKRGGAWSSITSQDGNTGGVWNHVTLRTAEPVHFTLPCPRVTTLAVSPAVAPAGAGEQRVRLHLAYSVTNPSGRPRPACIGVQVEPANFDGVSHDFTAEVVLDPQGGDVVLEQELDGVRLWEPRDHGFPHLYRLTSVIEVDGTARDTAVVETGFRTLAVSPIGESDGANGAFVVNGHRVFVRGTNLLPTYWLSEYTPDRVERDVAMLTAAGFNAVLIHNVVLPKWFYQHANRHGFLVVQMFPLQWSYEQSGAFQARATAQVRALADLLMNEPSVVSYELQNEPDMRTASDLDNRLMDFDLHLAMRTADPSRWATTFSSGNHAYPGQFYPLRDDNGFATLPARFLEDEVHGRRISRHRNMPTEFGIQGMPHPELLAELLGEHRVTRVLQRIRTDPKWVAAGEEAWEAAEKTIDEAKQVLGDGSWDAALRRFDWRLLWSLGELRERIARLERAQPESAGADERELLSLRLALVLLDVLHYGAFKGENFWFGLWRPARTLDGFVAASQDRQYRLHKDAIETYLNAGVVGPIVGYFGFMFRDADWEAPTWGVVDAAWVPKKAYRAYVESNHAVRVSLPHALRAPVKFPGDPWITARGDEWEEGVAPWVAADVIVANDTARDLADVRVTVWLERAGERIPLVSESGQARDTCHLRLGVGAQAGWSGPWPHERCVVPAGIEPGIYTLRARIEADGGLMSTNSYELLVLDRELAELDSLTKPVVAALLDGARRSQGFHYWRHGSVAYRARPGVRGLVRGFREARAQGIDLYEVVQGEHLFRHVLDELSHLAGSDRLLEDVWRIRSEIVSPREKARALLRHLEQFVERAEARLAGKGRARAGQRRSAPRGDTPAARPPHPVPVAVGRDVADERIRERGGSGED